MSTDACTAVRDLLPEYALGTITGEISAEVVEHTAGCVGCRARLGELTGVADSLLVLAPEREPSSAFATNVSDAIAAEAKRRRGSRHRRVWIAAGVAAAAFVVAAAGIAIGRATSPDGAESAAETSDVREQRMLGVGGRPAGHVLLYRGEPTMAVVVVDYGTLPPGEYSVATSGDDGSTVGHVTVDAAGRGAWGGTLGAAPVTGVRIVDSRGTVLCEARFGAPAGGSS